MSQSGGSSFPVGKVLLGCGCFSLVVGGGVVAAITIGGFFVVKEVKESDVGELIKELDDQVEVSKQGARNVKNKAKRAASDKFDEIKPEDMTAWFAQPLTKKEVEAHLAFVKAWEGSKAVKEARKNQETLKELGKKSDSERGAIDNLRTLNALKNAGMNSVEAQEHFHELAKKHGGVNAVMRRYFQVVAVVGAASGVVPKKSEDAVLASDATAKKMLGEHAKWARQYASWRKVNLEYYRVLTSSQSDPELLERLSKDPDFKKSSEEQKELNKIQKKQPGLLVLGKLPLESVKTWNALDESTREELISKYMMLPIVPFFAFLPAEKYDAHAMAVQVLALEYGLLATEASKEVEASEKPSK